MVEKQQKLGRYLSPLGVWALSFGCAVGWGAFVMPGGTFLPKAGPLGTALGISLGAIVMMIIGVNYHYLMNKYPDAGGTLTYAIKSFGYDHGFLSSWFLILVYVAIIWANASALPLIARYLFGDFFQFGFHYRVLGYDVYLGEILLSMAAILVCGTICILGKRLAVWLQIVLALVLFFGIVICFVGVLRNPGSAALPVKPLFSPLEPSKLKQIFTIFALSPWAFVGFESISNSAQGFKFSVKRSIWIMLAALVCGAIAYCFLSQIAVMRIPEDYPYWDHYIADLSQLSGIRGLPTFYSVSSSLGSVGTIILGFATLSGVLTGLIGNYTAGSRLLYTMAEENILPRRFTSLTKDGSPKFALGFLMLISVFIPLLGRTAIGWIVDVNTVGATIAYAYTSGAALYQAGKEKKRSVQITGIIGLVMSAVFFLYFMVFASGAMSTESYLILALWSILGFVCFRIVFGRDRERRFGKSTIVWIGLLFLIFFTSLMWVRNSTEDMTQRVIHNVSAYYEQENPDKDPIKLAETENYLADQLEEASHLQGQNSVIQMLLVLAALGIMFSIYTTMSRREKEMEKEKIRAEASSKAKSAFLSNMSHDIRTPMNAIIGYLSLAEQDWDDIDKLHEYLGKIKISSQHLLALINDVLEMSRIENGKVDLEPVPIDLKKTMEEVCDLFINQMERKNITFKTDYENVRDPHVLCDKNRLNRVLLNLISNANKYTPEGGTVWLILRQVESKKEGSGTYELRVKDSGIGMTKEFAENVFEAFERERSATVNGIQGTGLGMAITKSIVDLMGGTIDVYSAPGEGTEFVVQLTLEIQSKEMQEDSSVSEESVLTEESMDLSGKRVLLADDMLVNREIAAALLQNMGLAVDKAENGRDALDRLAASVPGTYDAVLLDIQMPVMDGYEAARQIRALSDPDLSNTPIIAMTANAFSEDVQKALDAGMNAHVAKPIDLDDLRAKLCQVL